MKSNSKVELVSRIAVELSSANVGFLGAQLYKLLTPAEVVERSVAIAAEIERYAEEA